jgi:hypothetical protein
MAKYTHIPYPVEAISFQEFIEYGKNNGANIVNGMPWSFEYKGLPVTHENDECYLIPAEPGTHNLFTPNDMLVTGEGGKVFPLKIEIFEKTFELAE